MDPALAPSSPHPRPIKPQKPAPDPDVAEERVLTSLTKAPGWPLFVERYKQSVLDLKTLKGVQLQGKTPTQVGEIYLVASEAANRMELELNKIIAIAEVIDGLTDEA